MNQSVVVKNSKIQGKGVFARRDIKKGEVVLKWDISHQLKKSEVDKLTAKEKKYITYMNRRYVQMQSPEKYVNHSCDFNTLPKKYCDVAIRNIKKGEEITSNYYKTSLFSSSMKCMCGSKKCKGIVRC
ncbi:MAG: SET domain-containing protein [Candidatus Woesearchaeota archaeon]